MLAWLAFLGSCLKCFEEDLVGQSSLGIVNCAYFAFGNTQVCFTKRTGNTGIRGCQYLVELGKKATKKFLPKFLYDISIIQGVDLGPAKNLTEVPTCAFREPLEDDGFPDAILFEESVEVCACSHVRVFFLA